MEGYVGTWREECVIHKDNVVVFPDHVEYSKIASCFVNPMTILYFYHEMNKLNETVAIQDGACSSLGKMFIKFAPQHKLTLINLVRRKEQVDILESLGAENILNTSDSGFDSNFEAKIKELSPKIFFSWIGGQKTFDNFLKLPHYSKLFLFSDLSQENITFRARQLMGAKKSIGTIFLTDFFKTASKKEIEKAIQIMVDDLSSTDEANPSVFETKYLKEYSLKQFKTALKESKKIASEGKCIFLPNK
jgi:NADPH:quinone reductase